MVWWVSCSVLSDSVTPRTVAYQAPQSMGFSRQEYIGRTDAEAEVPILWPPEVKSRLIGKDPGAGKD